jgi:hypothetical protein
MRIFFKILGIILIVLGSFINFVGLVGLGNSGSDPDSFGYLGAMIEGAVLLFVGIGLYLRNKNK